MATSRERFVLAIDLGTSGPKVGLVSRQGEVIGCEGEPSPLLLLPHGGAEQRPEDWWTAICTAVRRLMGQGLVQPEAVAAVSCTTQWSGTVPVDRQGVPLMNAIIWMDARGAPHIRQLVSGRLQVQGYEVGKLLTWLRLTGGVPGLAGKDPIAHILYIRSELPDIYRQTYLFLEPKDYLNFRLTGRFAASYDSICLHWMTDNRDLGQVDYDPRLLRMAGLEREKLPDLCRSIDLLGPLRLEAAADLGLLAGTPVVAGSPDIQTAAVGSGAVQDYAAHLYIGTSSWLACHVPYKKTDLLHNMASLPSAIPNRYLLTNEQEQAGGCLNYLIDQVLFPADGPGACPRPGDPYAVLNQMAASASPGSDKLIFTPWLYGERTPVDDHRVRGGFFNQTLGTTRSEMVRAVFEGVAFNTRWLFEYVEKFIRRRVDAVTLVGGGALSDLWCQIHADVLGRTICQARNPRQVNVRGAGFLAWVALGQMQFADVPAYVPIAAEYNPIPENRPIYDELFREFVQLYYRSRPIYHRLNR